MIYKLKKGGTMKKVSKEVLKTAANNLMFDMSEEQYDTLLKEFDIIQSQMEFLGTIEGIDDLEPMTFPFDVTIDYLREDEAEKPLTQKQALKNAHDVVLGQIKLPKVVN